MIAGKRYAGKLARTVWEGAVGKGPAPRAPRRRPTSLEAAGVRFPPPTRPSSAGVGCCRLAAQNEVFCRSGEPARVSRRPTADPVVHAGWAGFAEGRG
jgi:hypothetical protein